jgi:hypothetical protein
VFINVPRLVVGKMPWNGPPSGTDRQQMLGPAARDVAKLYRTHAPSAHQESRS